MTNKTKTPKQVKTKVIKDVSQLVSFRVDKETYKQLSQIANRKKTTKTRVIKELIRIAYIGLYSKTSKVMNEFYIDVLKLFESKLTPKEREALELKKEVIKQQKQFFKTSETKKKT